MRLAKQIIAYSTVAGGSAAIGYALIVIAKPELVSGLLSIIGIALSLTTALFFQAIRKIDDLREKSHLDEPHRSWLRRRMEHRKKVLLGRWVTSLCLGLVCIVSGIVSHCYVAPPYIILAAYIALGLGITLAVLMGYDFLRLYALSHQLQDDYENRKKEQAIIEQIRGPKVA